jgi:hypothetical protein
MASANEGASGLSFVRAPRRALVAALVLAGGALSFGCADDLPTEADALPAEVGPSPLRRLSNEEYTNALADLFPDVHVEVPALPADTLVAGFENAAAVQKPSDVRIARYEAIAGAYAREVTRDSAHVRASIGCDWDSPSRADACMMHFLETSGRRVFRRPLSGAERDRFALKFQGWKATIDFEAAVRLTLASWLQSPAFVYRPEVPVPEASAEPAREGQVVPVEPYAMASRLSFFLWASTPDDVLLDAAEKNELDTAERVRAQAERMLRDPRAKRTFVSFHRQWLGLDRLLDPEHVARSAEVDPSWSAATVLSARRETELFVGEVLASGGSFEDLFTSRRAFVDREMARIYGVSAPDPNGFAEVLLPEEQRAGLLTRVAFLASTSHRGSTSPPVRGNAVQLRLLCQVETPPPPGVDLSQPMVAPGEGPKTTRTLFEERTSPAGCRGCHTGLNGFGFALESYSASGAFRREEHGLPIDARGAVVGTESDRPITGPLELSATLAKSRAVRRCATLQWMRYAMGRAPIADELPLVEALTDRFSRGGDVRKLIVDLVGSNTFRSRRVEVTSTKPSTHARLGLR